MAKLEGLVGERCPCCAGWPGEINLQIVEEIIEVGQPLPAPDPCERRPGEHGPCAGCGRMHRARVVELEGD
jgi:hypothetical protein